MRRDGELSQTAFVTFKEAQALETALLLSVSLESSRVPCELNFIRLLMMGFCNGRELRLWIKPSLLLLPMSRSDWQEAVILSPWIRVRPSLRYAFSRSNVDFKPMSCHYSICQLNVYSIWALHDGYDFSTHLREFFVNIAPVVFRGGQILTIYVILYLSSSEF